MLLSHKQAHTTKLLSSVEEKLDEVGEGPGEKGGEVRGAGVATETCLSLPTPVPDPPPLPRSHRLSADPERD